MAGSLYLSATILVMEERSILLVEDEQKIADTLRMGLLEEGFHTEVAYDGMIGWRLFNQQPFGLVILDINLPGMNGYELCRNIRSRNGQVPIIMLTALSSLSDKIEGYDTGADDYLVKPFDFLELLARVKALLRRSGIGDEPEHLLHVADLELDLLSRTVTRASKRIDVQPREFRLLEHLMRHAGQVVTRTMLLEKVWDYHFDPQTNVIDVHVSRLRAKVDKGFERPMIHTVRGAGYMVRAGGEA